MATVFARFLPFGMEVKCVSVSEDVCRSWQWEWPIAKRRITSKWIHGLAQDLAEILVMSQWTADYLFGLTGKRGVTVGVACSKKAHNF